MLTSEDTCYSQLRYLLKFAASFAAHSSFFPFHGKPETVFCRFATQGRAVLPVILSVFFKYKPRQMKISLKVESSAVIAIMLFAGCNKRDITSPDSLSTTIVNDATALDLGNCKMRRIYQGSEGSEYQYSGLFFLQQSGQSVQHTVP
jgi:hypothetical protein